MESVYMALYHMMSLNFQEAFQISERLHNSKHNSQIHKILGHRDAVMWKEFSCAFLLMMSLNSQLKWCIIFHKLPILSNQSWEHILHVIQT